MKRDNKTQYVLLGLLQMHPQSGYDLKKAIEQTVGYFWSESYGQIYPTLASLERTGYIKKNKIIAQSSRQRQVYGITPTGLKSLQSWLQVPVFLPKVRNELLLKLFFGEAVSKQTNIKNITNYLEQTQQVHTILKQIEQMIRQHPKYNPKKPYNLLTVQFGVLATEAEMKWCKQALKTLSI